MESNQSLTALVYPFNTPSNWRLPSFEVQTVKGGVRSGDSGRFVVDENSMLYVAGTKIDWKEEVFGSQFEIVNPNAQSGCGCGESFGV